jgi:hypothetical protein
MERIKVKSSNISSIGYDAATKTLEVEFSNSGVYQYKEVPKEVYEGFSKAESIGSYFAKSVRAKGFSYLKVEQKKVEPVRECPDHEDGHHFIQCDEWGYVCTCGKERK